MTILKDGSLLLTNAADSNAKNSAIFEVYIFDFMIVSSFLCIVLVIIFVKT